VRGASGFVPKTSDSLPARRRVAGLRREELATLAGTSSAYCLRLEQGRDIHPSAPVVDALARAPQLDVNAPEYLHRVAGAGCVN
jgi:predicted transcriptional regulator